MMNNSNCSPIFLNIDSSEISRLRNLLTFGDNGSCKTNVPVYSLNLFLIPRRWKNCFNRILL